jgi:hypothetical protein
MKYLHKSYYCLTYRLWLNTTIKTSLFLLLLLLFFLPSRFFFPSVHSIRTLRVSLPDSFVAVCMRICVYVNDNESTPPPSVLSSHLTSCFFSLLGDDNVCMYHLKQNDEDDDGSAKEDTRSS